MANKKLIDSLNQALADSFEMYMRAHGMHWNIEGMFFPMYHDFFGELYLEIYASIDSFAEQVRAIDGYPGYGSQYFANANMLPETKQTVGARAKDMLEELAMCNAIVIKSLNTAFVHAEKDGNQGLMDFLAARLDAHAKHGWMIKASLKSSEQS